MSWVRFDDQYPIHRKVAGLSDTAFRLHSAAIFWCVRNKTDGFVPEEDLDQVCAQVRTPARFASECVRRNAWHDAAYACDSENCPGPREGKGWVIHDYLEYQPTKEETGAAEKKVQEKKSSGGKLGNHRRWHAARGVVDPDCPWCPSVSDRSDRSDSDRSFIAPSRPDLSLVDVVSQSAGRNARIPDDDDFSQAVIDLIRKHAGQDITPGEGCEIAAKILAGRQAKNRLAYLEAAISEEADPLHRWLGSPPIAPESPPKPAWCGYCDPETRLLGDELPGRCPKCHPLAGKEPA